MANSEELVRQHAQEILNMTIKGFPVTRILVSEAVEIAAEYYVSFTIDRNARSVVLIISAAGGMDIEEVARKTPEKITRYLIDPLIGLPKYLAQRFAFALFEQPEQAKRMTSILQDLDDAKGLSYVRMDGNIGCMVNGAGLAMTTMDMIKLYGGSPANFLDIGGSSNPVKVIEAMKLLLNDSKVKAVFINIFGGITRCDDVAIGLIQAFDQLQTEIPVIVRLTGTNENIGRKLLKDSNRFQVAETMNEATLMVVKSVKGETL